MLQALFGKEVLKATIKLNHHSSVEFYNEKTNEFEMMIFAMLCFTRAVRIKSRFNDEFNLQEICDFFILQKQILSEYKSIEKLNELTIQFREKKNSPIRQSQFKVKVLKAKSGNYFLNLGFGLKDINLEAFVFITYWVTYELISDATKTIYIESFAELAKQLKKDKITIKQATVLPNEILYNHI